MKTYIIDNGGEYSDHQIHFVMVPEHKAEALEQLIAFVAAHPSDLSGGGFGFGYSAFVIAVVDGPIDWRDPDAYESLGELIEGLYVYDRSGPDLAIELDSLSRACLE